MERAAAVHSDDLVRRSVLGDREAFATLVRRHQQEIHRFFQRTCATEEDARDQTQLAFVRAYRGLDRFEGRSSFRTWLFRIATNLARNYHRDRGRRPEVSLTDRQGRGERDVEAPAAGVDRHLERREEHEALRRAVAALSPRQRSVVTWRIDHDLAFAEIAEVEGITVNNAKVTYCHAVKKLRKAMTGDATRDRRGREAP